MHSPEEIAAKLRQVEVLLAQGKTVKGWIRGVGTATTYIEKGSPW
jgi:hypothetical protein